MDQPMKPIIAPTWTIAIPTLAIPTLARPDHSGRPREIFDGVQHRGGVRHSSIITPSVVGMASQW